MVSDRDLPALPTYRRMFNARRQLRSLSRETRIAKMGDHDWSGPRAGGVHPPSVRQYSWALLLFPASRADHVRRILLEG